MLHRQTLTLTLTLVLTSTRVDREKQHDEQ